MVHGSDMPSQTHNGPLHASDGLTRSWLWQHHPTSRYPLTSNSPLARPPRQLPVDQTPQPNPMCSCLLGQATFQLQTTTWLPVGAVVRVHEYFTGTEHYPLQGNSSQWICSIQKKGEITDEEVGLQWHNIGQRSGIMMLYSLATELHSPPRITLHRDAARTIMTSCLKSGNSKHNNLKCVGVGKQHGHNHGNASLLQLTLCSSHTWLLTLVPLGVGEKWVWWGCDIPLAFCQHLLDFLLDLPLNGVG